MTSEKKSIAIPGAIVAAPPPKEDRIYFVGDEVDAYAKGKPSNVPLREIDRLIFYQPEQTIFHLSRAVGREALRSILEYGIDPELEWVEKMQIISALPENDAEALVTYIMDENNGFSVEAKIWAVQRFICGAPFGERRDKADSLANQLIEQIIESVPESERASLYDELVKIVPPSATLSFLHGTNKTRDIGVLSGVARPDTDDDVQIFNNYVFEAAHNTISTRPADAPWQSIELHDAFRMINDLPEHYRALLAPIVNDYIQDTGFASALALISGSHGDSFDRSSSYSTWYSQIAVSNEKLDGADKGYDITQSVLHKMASSEVRTFEKSGSKTYILPEEYEASVRVVSLPALEAWVAAFRNWPVWYEAGFNYVPIEPIQSIHTTENIGEMAVVTTNLSGRSLEHVISHLPDHERRLEGVKKKIQSVLRDTLRIDHAHLHANNFVVVPYVDSRGAPDLSRCPRLYAIDFDAARKK